MYTLKSTGVWIPEVVQNRNMQHICVGRIEFCEKNVRFAHDFSNGMEKVNFFSSFFGYRPQLRSAKFSIHLQICNERSGTINISARIASLEFTGDLDAYFFAQQIVSRTFINEIVNVKYFKRNRFNVRRTSRNRSTTRFLLFMLEPRVINIFLNNWFYDDWSMTWLIFIHFFFKLMAWIAHFLSGSLKLWSS